MNTLPSIDSLERWTDAQWAALRARLEALVGDVAPMQRALAPFAGLAEPLVRAPRLDLLRELDAPWARAVRVLCFEDALDEPAARELFGAALCEDLRGAGLLVADEAGRVRTPFCWTVADGAVLLADDLRRGGDAVMGMGQTTEKLARYALPDEPVGLALDLGCGAGALALALAARAERVVATDVNPRALRLVRLNARLNGVRNVEVREGSLFDPVADERFDLVVSQPPYLARFEGSAAATFAHGGARGDELALRLLAGLDAHLAHDGLAVLGVEWPHGPYTVSERVRAALAAPARDVVLLEAAVVGAEAHAVLLSSAEHPSLGEPYVAAVRARLSHYAGARLAPFTQTVVAVGARAARGAGQTLALRASSATTGREGEALRAALRSQALAREGALLERPLRCPAGLELEQRQRGVGDAVPSTIAARLPASSLRAPAPLDEASLAVLTAVHEAPVASAGRAAVAEQFGLELDEGAYEGLVRGFVAAGLLA